MLYIEPEENPRGRQKRI